MPNRIFTGLGYSLVFRVMLLLLAGGLTFGTAGCKSKKKLAMEQAAREYAEKIENAKADLRAILNDDGTMPLSEMERRLLNIRSQNLNDPEVQDLISQVEAKIIAAKEELEKLKAEEERKLREAEEEKKKKESGGYLDDYFEQIAGARSIDAANSKISETLKLFADNEVPVLIIISREGDIVDYDKPAVIKDYLHYLKDQKRYTSRVYRVKTDDYGLITELELIKK
ncbi:MAG: hypothetical protein JXA03_08585 [Bacteroidales bacterium]|nr:hypothetical protein [Bacteroidales bacterium]